MDEISLIYFEKQVAALCGVHCLNTLLQGPYFSAVDLGQIAQELDQLERQFMAESGLESEDYLKFVAEDSGNVAENGMFSIQVLSKALEVWGLVCTPLDSPEMVEAAAAPESEEAFLCNLQEHWFTLRKLAGSEWWNLNSLFAAPQPLSQFYLSAFLGSLREQGYTIFVVRGALPAPQTPDESALDGPGQWFTPQQALEASKGSQDAKQQGYLKAALEGALSKASTEGSTVTLRPKRARGSDDWGGSGSGGGDAGRREDEELAKAIAASLAGAGPSNGAPAAGAFGEGVSMDVDDADSDLAAAIAASLERREPAEPAQAPVEAPAAHQAAKQPSEPPTPEATALSPEQAAPSPEPDAGEGVVELAFRAPGGQRLQRRFRATDPLAAVRQFLQQTGIDMRRHALATQWPRKVLTDETATLEQAGIQDKEALSIELLS